MKNIKQFFAYARARHQIYLDRKAGKPRPWTKDPVFNYRFTNVFRELDKTTVWFREKVRDPLKDKPEVMLATVVFRLLNRIEVGEAIFLQKDILSGATAWDTYLERGDTRILKAAIKQYCGKGPYTTGAYILSSPPGFPKLDGMMKVIGDFAKGSKRGMMTPEWRKVAAFLLDEPGRKSLEETWEWFTQFDYFGPFHSYEIVTDLRHTALLNKAPDIMTWANPGPGARRGMNRVRGLDKSDKTMKRDDIIKGMREILAASRDAKHWPQGGKATKSLAKNALDWPKWEMRDVEHTLCEWDKYQRVLLGQGTPRGVYR